MLGHMAESQSARWWYVRRAQNLKPATYRCPLCGRHLPALSEHLLMYPEGDSSGRRHAHTECVLAARKAGKLPTREEWLKTQPRPPSAWSRLVARIRRREAQPDGAGRPGPAKNRAGSNDQRPRQRLVRLPDAEPHEQRLGPGSTCSPKEWGRRAVRRLSRCDPRAEPHETRSGGRATTPRRTTNSRDTARTPTDAAASGSRPPRPRACTARTPRSTPA